MTGRDCFSVSVFHLGTHCVWLLVFGGYNHKAATSIVELSEYKIVVIDNLYNNNIIVQETSGQWSAGRVIKSEMLNNNTDYQERLREARIKGTSEHGTEDWLKLRRLEHKRKLLQQKVYCYQLVSMVDVHMGEL